MDSFVEMNNSTKNKEVKPRIDDSRVEVHEGKNRAGVKCAPCDAEFLSEKLLSKTIQGQQGENGSNDIRKTGSEFIDSKNEHG